jgi:hypothetical protein
MIISILQPEMFSALRDKRVHIATETQVFELPMQMKSEAEA